MKTNRTEYILFITFLVGGLLLLTLGMLLSLFSLADSDKIDTVGVITDIVHYEDFDGETEQDVYVAYEVDGVAYESRLSGYSSSFYVGKEIAIYYRASDPHTIGMRSLDMILLVIPALGIIFTAVGGMPLFLKYRAKKRAAYLRQWGMRVDASYIRTEVNRNYAVNRRHPYRILCEWEDPYTHEKRVFKSTNLWGDPTSLIAASEITTFPVYIDEKNSKKYTMDTDMLFHA